MESQQAQAQTQDSNLELGKILERLTQVKAAIDLTKKLYDEQDMLTAQLKELIGTDVEVSHGDTIFSIVDNFASKNVVFRPAAVRRFELKSDSFFARKIKENKKNGI